MKLPNVTVIGLGCIGGSLAMSLTPDAAIVRGWSTSPEDCTMARAFGIEVPEGPLEQAMTDAEIVLIAVPVQAIASVAIAVVGAATANAAIVHCGGVQSRASLHLDEATYSRVIGSHPLAGSHESGFAAARADLFAGCTVSIESRCTEAQLEWLQWIWRRVGSRRLDYRTAEEHDTMMVWISHLPQLASTALAAALAAEHIDPASIGPGARDTTRLAASAFDQWSSLLQGQPAVLDAALARLQGEVVGLREALSRGDQRALQKIWDSARDWRRSAESTK
jgi:prephenate dehydrogenase